MLIENGSFSQSAIPLGILVLIKIVSLLGKAKGWGVSGAYRKRKVSGKMPEVGDFSKS